MYRTFKKKRLDDLQGRDLSLHGQPVLVSFALVLADELLKAGNEAVGGAGDVGGHQLAVHLLLEVVGKIVLDESLQLVGRTLLTTNYLRQEK